MALNLEELRRQLDELQKPSRRNSMRPPDYKQFLPLVLGSRLNDNSEVTNFTRDTILRGSEGATRTSEVMAMNTKMQLEMQRRQEELRRARQQMKQARKSQPKPLELQPDSNQTFVGNYEGGRNFGPKWGQDNTPEVSDLQQINPNAPIVNVNWRGRSFNVNRQVAPIFVAFLDDLWKSGYRPVSIGGHNERNIAGTNTPSLHSHGLAIDIDPSRNPVQYGGGNVHALPKNVAQLAAKYGLSWGGSWNSYKDPMHFSVAYGGVE